MYSRSLHIKIFSPDLQLETLLKSVDQLNFAFKLRLALILQKENPAAKISFLWMSPVNLHSRILGL